MGRDGLQDVIESLDPSFDEIGQRASGTQDSEEDVRVGATDIEISQHDAFPAASQ